MAHTSWWCWRCCSVAPIPHPLFQGGWTGVRGALPPNFWINENKFVLSNHKRRTTDTFSCISVVLEITTNYVRLELLKVCSSSRSLILYFCIFFCTSESSLLRRVFWPLHLCVSLLLLVKRKVFTSSFFYMCLPLGVGVENMKDIFKAKKHEYLRN